jgi:hypothetical protein
MNGENERVKTKARLNLWEVEEQIQPGSSVERYFRDKEAQAFIEQERLDQATIRRTIMANPEMMVVKSTTRVSVVDVKL